MTPEAHEAENVLGLNCSGVFMGPEICQTSEKCTLEMAHPPHVRFTLEKSIRSHGRVQFTSEKSQESAGYEAARL